MWTVRVVKIKLVSTNICETCPHSKRYDNHDNKKTGVKERIDKTTNFKHAGTYTTLDKTFIEVVGISLSSY